MKRDLMVLIEAFGDNLSPRQLDVLRVMRDCEEEIVQEGLTAFLGDIHVSARTIIALLRACAISEDSTSRGVHRYTINETGRKILEKRK